MTTKSARVLWLSAAALALAGCRGGQTASRFDVAGTIAYDGQPLPAGRIYFTPDPGKQNTGLQGVADVKDGHYDTRVGRGIGGPGGPVIVLIQGFDGNVTAERPMGNAVFSYKTTIELPRDSATKDFDLKRAEVEKIEVTGPSP
jgi:hypothetical protein